MTEIKKLKLSINGNSMCFNIPAYFLKTKQIKKNKLYDIEIKEHNGN